MIYKPALYSKPHATTYRECMPHQLASRGKVVLSKSYCNLGVNYVSLKLLASRFAGERVIGVSEF